jgi:hypothetical protein
VSYPPAELAEARQDGFNEGVTFTTRADERNWQALRDEIRMLRTALWSAARHHGRLRIQRIDLANFAGPGTPVSLRITSDPRTGDLFVDAIEPERPR